jgi:hypothetical protein
MAHFLFIFWFFNISTLLFTITQHYIISLTEITSNKLQIYKKCLLYICTVLSTSFIAGLYTFLHECKLHNADLSDTGQLQAEVCWLKQKKTDVGTKVMNHFFIIPTNAHYIHFITLKSHIKILNNHSYMFWFHLKPSSGSS